MYVKIISGKYAIDLERKINKELESINENDLISIQYATDGRNLMETERAMLVLRGSKNEN